MTSKAPPPSDRASSKHRCGTVAIVGRPNVGKSTLLNRLMGQKIAIVSPKPETTRGRLLGILTLEDAQVLFLDTPGLGRPAKTLLEKHQIQEATGALEESDILLFVTDATAGWTEEDERILKRLSKPMESDPTDRTQKDKPVFLAINKVDRIDKGLILAQIRRAADRFSFQEIFPISALSGENVPSLLRALVAALPEGPALYPPDHLTDRPVRSLVCEIIREKAILFTHEEVPYGVAVAIEEWRPGKSPSSGLGKERSHPLPLYIRATIYVERTSHKGILIGKGGTLLKRIGAHARPEIEALVGTKVFLDLWVKVAKDWRKDPAFLRRLGYIG